MIDRAMTAAEFIALRMQDPAYVEALELDRIREAEDLRDEQRETKALLEDLHRVGICVASVWDLVNTAEPYAKALPVLIEHLERGHYTPMSRQGIARALAVRDAVKYWDRLTHLYLHPRDETEREGVTAALAACAGKAQFDDIVDLMRAESPPGVAIFFLRSVVRIDRERGWSVVEELADHPVFTTQAQHMLHERTRRQRAKQRKPQ
ncbi:hypothetical protein ACUOFU_08455 [Microbacterium arabinogalactanolyticum]|uniref:hypothetical protein n=1 Tax=Microbacterium arabinogalactanolyticum TaxID=69365 RepID=UPI004044C7FB